jgi:hypothetical protein
LSDSFHIFNPFNRKPSLMDEPFRAPTEHGNFSKRYMYFGENKKICLFQFA